MQPNVSQASSIQKDGEQPLILTSGCAPGESGISIVHLRYRGAAHFKGTSRYHAVSFVTSARMHCRLADRTLSHDAPNGSLGICPAGIDASAALAMPGVKAILTAARLRSE